MTGDKSCACLVGHFGQPTIRARFCSLWRPLHSQVNPNRTHFETLALVQFSVRRLSLSGRERQSLRSHSARSASLSRKLCIWAFRVLPEELVEKSKPCPLDPSAEGWGSARPLKNDEDWLLDNWGTRLFSQRVFLKQLVPLLKSDWSKRRSKHAY